MSKSAVAREPFGGRTWRVLYGFRCLTVLIACLPMAACSQVNLGNPTPITGSAEATTYRADLARSGDYSGRGIPQIHQNSLLYKAPSAVLPPLIVADGFIYFLTDEVLHAVRIDTATEQWHVNASKAPPSIERGVLFYGTSDGIHAVNSKTGQEKWQFKTGDSVESSPAIFVGGVYFGSSDGYFYALDEQSGRLKWKLKADDQIRSDTAIYNGTAYFDSLKLVALSLDYGTYELSLRAVELGTGQSEWKFSPEGGSDTPSVADGIVYSKSPVFSQIISQTLSYVVHV